MTATGFTIFPCDRGQPRSLNSPICEWSGLMRLSCPPECPDCADHQRTVITDPARIRAIRNQEEA